MPSMTRWKQVESWVWTNSIAGAKSFWIASEVPVRIVENNDTPNISSIPPRLLENSFSCQLVENESQTTYNARHMNPFTFCQIEISRFIPGLAFRIGIFENFDLAQNFSIWSLVSEYKNNATKTQHERDKPINVAKWFFVDKLVHNHNWKNPCSSKCNCYSDKW